jgi:hypothetical protein
MLPSHDRKHCGSLLSPSTSWLWWWSVIFNCLSPKWHVQGFIDWPQETGWITSCYFVQFCCNIRHVFHPSKVTCWTARHDIAWSLGVCGRNTRQVTNKNTWEQDWFILIWPRLSFIAWLSLHWSNHHAFATWPSSMPWVSILHFNVQWLSKRKFWLSVCMQSQFRL